MPIPPLIFVKTTALFTIMFIKTDMISISNGIRISVHTVFALQISISLSYVLVLNHAYAKERQALNPKIVTPVFILSSLSAGYVC